MINANEGIFPYKNKSNYVKSEGEVNDMPSMTEPGDSETIQEIMERVLRTGEIPKAKDTLQYFDQDDLDNIRSYPIDLVDLQQGREELEAAIEAMDKAIAIEEEEKQKEEEENDPGLDPPAPPEDFDPAQPEDVQ